MSRLRVFVNLLLIPLAASAAAAGDPPATPAYLAWKEGQQALEKGEVDRAVGQFELSLRLDPGLVPARLSLAAAYVDRGEDAKAAPQLARYVAARPTHWAVRAHYAELLHRLGRAAEARAQYEAFAAGAQEQPALGPEHAIHCHGRLFEIAEAQGDDYAAHLHRGIGLYLLGCQRAALPGRGGAAEALLCKAAAELTLARRCRPDEARPCWYLHVVWARLGQRQPAQRWLRRAEALAPFSALTPAEGRALALAWDRCEAEARRK